MPNRHKKSDGSTVSKNTLPPRSVKQGGGRAIMSGVCSERAIMSGVCSETWRLYAFGIGGASVSLATGGFSMSGRW